MTDVLQVKEEPTSVVRESRLPNLPSDLTEDGSPQGSLTLEQVANNTEKLRRFELLDRYLLQLSKGEHSGSFDVAKDANYLRKLVRSDDTHVQVKVSELLLQYFKSMRLNTQYDPNLGGIQDSMLLLKLYQVVHDDCCYYLLPNSKAGETFNKFLCNLLSTASSEYVFAAVVKLFQRTVENVLAKYNNTHSPSVSREMSTEDTRVVIGVMKTLLTLTRAFGSPPAPRDVLCTLSVVVINSTNAHTCRVYSYNVAAFLIKDVHEEETRRRLLKGLNEVQYNQVVALVKECNSLTNTCNWKFKYAPSDLVSTSTSRVQVQSNSYVPSSATTTSASTYTTTGSTTTASNVVSKDDIRDRNSSSTDKTSTTTQNTNSGVTNTQYSPVQSSTSNTRKVDSKGQKTDTVTELPSNWYKDLFNTFESNRGEGKNVVVDKNAWKWKNDALLNTLKKLESVSSVEMDSVSGQFATLFESLFKYESAIPVVINSLNLFTVLTVKGNCDFLNVGKSQLLSDMLFEKLKENNKKVRDACVQSLVEVVKRSKLSVVSESVKKALVNVSPTCRENMCNFLNGKLLTTTDAEFYQKLQQLLSLLSEYLRQNTSEKAPKVKQAILSVLEVADNFSLVYSNQLTYTSTSTNSNSSVYSNVSTTSNAEDSAFSKERETDFPNNSGREQKSTATAQSNDLFDKNTTSTNVSSVASNSHVVDARSCVHTASTNFRAGGNHTVQASEDTMTTTAASYSNLDSSSEFGLEYADKNANFGNVYLDAVKPRGPMSVENLVDVVDSEVLDRFRSVDHKSLDEALYNLCLWMTDNTRLVKSVDFYLLKLMSDFYSSFSNKLTVDMFFSSAFSHPLSDDAFSEVLEFLEKYQDLKVLNTLLSKNNSNTNKLLNPLNNLYYSQRTTPSNGLVDRNIMNNNSSSSKSTNVAGKQRDTVSANQSSTSSSASTTVNSNSTSNSTVDKVLLTVFDLLKKYVSDESYVLLDEVVVKLVSFLAYFVKVKSESCLRQSLDLLFSLNQRYEVYKYLDEELVASVTYSRPSKTLSAAYLSSATRFEKYISKDLYMIMYQSDQDYKRRASYYWKGFVGDKTSKSRDMLEGKGRKDLTSWLSYCLFEDMCHKYVVAGLELMTDYLLSKGLQFDAEESVLLTESLCSYGTFGRYQTKAMSVYHKMSRCLSYSFDTVQFMFEYVEKASAHWVTVVSKALVMMLEFSKKDVDQTLVTYVSRRLESSSKMPTYYKNKLRQWLESVSTVSEDRETTSNTFSSNTVVSKDTTFSKDRDNSDRNSSSTDKASTTTQNNEQENRDTQMQSVEQDEQLAATSLSENSLKSKYSREHVDSKYSSVTRSKEDDDRDKDTSSRSKDKDNSRENGQKTVVQRSESSELQESREFTEDLREEVRRLTENVSSVTGTKGSSGNLVSSDNTSRLVMERLDTVHQDVDQSMEPVSTTESTYESKSNFPSSEFPYATNTTSAFSKDRDNSDRNSSSTDFVSTTNQNTEQENRDIVVESSVSQEAFYEGKCRRVADREVVDEKRFNLVDQVLLDEETNVDLDLESCRRLSQQILDTPSSRFVGVSKRKSNELTRSESQNEKRRLSREDLSTNTSASNVVSKDDKDRGVSNSSSTDKTSTTTESNTDKVDQDTQMTSVEQYNRQTQMSVVRSYDKDRETRDVEVETTSYSSRYDKQTEMSTSRQYGKEVGSNTTSTKYSSSKDSSTTKDTRDNYTSTDNSKDNEDKDTQMSTNRQYDKETSVNLLDRQRRSENLNERELDADLSSNYYGSKVYSDNRSSRSNTVYSDRSKEGSEMMVQVVDSESYQQDVRDTTTSKDRVSNSDRNSSSTDFVSTTTQNTLDRNTSANNRDENKEVVVEYDNTNKSSTSSHSSSKDTYPSVVVEFDSDSDFVSGEVYGLNLVETVLSHCSRVNNACLVSSYKEYKKLADTLCPGNFSKTCLESCTEVLKYKSTLKGSFLRLLSSPLVEMCHNAVLLLSKKLIKKVHSREQYDQTLEALTSTVEIFKLVTSDLQDKFVLQFCNVVTNLLSLPKDLFQNEKLYCLVSELVAENALKQSTDVMYKLLAVMVELSMESLEGDLDRLLMAKLRFTKILQMQILLTLKNNGSENSLDADSLKSKHVNFIRRLETFANRRTAHNVEKVIQTSNYLISTI